LQALKVKHPVPVDIVVGNPPSTQSFKEGYNLILILVKLIPVATLTAAPGLQCEKPG